MTWWQIASFIGGAVAGNLLARFVLNLIGNHLDRKEWRRRP